jgi:GntR family transcriptional regulator
MFAINPTNPAPIWRQIEEGVRRMIALGALQPGASVPSVRDLAKDLRVNPNTVARAYQRLAEGGVLAVKRGEGTFVADAPSQPKKTERNEAMRDAATRYASTAIAVGSELEEAVEEVEAAFERVVRDHRRKA